MRTLKVDAELHMMAAKHKVSLDGFDQRSGRRHACVDLDATPVQRVGHVVPNIGSVGEKEHVVEAYTASCNCDESDTEKSTQSNLLTARHLELPDDVHW